MKMFLSPDRLRLLINLVRERCALQWMLTG